MRHFIYLLLTGLLIMAVSAAIGVENAFRTSSYFAADQLMRDTSPELARLRSGIESTDIWLPHLSFLGLAFILMAFAAVLAAVGERLQRLGAEVMAGVPRRARFPLARRPESLPLMWVLAGIGMLFTTASLLASLFIGSTAYSLFLNPQVRLDAAPPGSTLLLELARVRAAAMWLQASSFLGLAVLLLAVVQGLAAIIFTLRYQRVVMPMVVDKLTGLPGMAEAMAGDGPSRLHWSSSGRGDELWKLS